MDRNTHISDKVHSTLDNWLGKLDHFQMQLSLGKMEVKEEFEKGKKQLHEFLHDVANVKKPTTDITLEKAGEVKKVLGEYKDWLTKEEKITEASLKRHKENLKEVMEKLKAVK